MYRLIIQSRAQQAQRRGAHPLLHVRPAGPELAAGAQCLWPAEWHRVLLAHETTRGPGERRAWGAAGACSPGAEGSGLLQCASSACGSH